MLVNFPMMRQSLVLGGLTLSISMTLSGVASYSETGFFGLLSVSVVHCFCSKQMRHDVASGQTLQQIVLAKLHPDCLVITAQA